MAGSLSPLHTALDLHQLDPKSKEDRPYLVSLLRRLGYTEVEIKQVVSGKKTLAEVDEARDDAPAPTPAPAASEVVEDTGGTRIIELEYGGAEEIPEFEPVRAKAHPGQLEETEFDVEESEPALDDDNEFVLLVPDDEEDEDEGLVEFTEVDDDLVEFTEADSDDWGWDDTPEPALAQESAPAPTPSPGGHKHGEYRLFRRELDGGQHVYFYSRKEPADAEPADIPDGYGVKESEESGLPYLARVE